MKDDLDSLEKELETLRPQQVSPALQQRVAERLAEPSTRGGLDRRGRVALVGGLAAAAGLIVAVLLWRGGDAVPEPEPKVVTQPSPPKAEGANHSPTLHAYQCALAESPEALDALLDHHAVWFGGSGRLAEPSVVPHWSNANSPDLPGVP